MKSTFRTKLAIKSQFRTLLVLLFFPSLNCQTLKTILLIFGFYFVEQQCCATVNMNIYILEKSVNSKFIFL